MRQLPVRSNDGEAFSVHSPLTNDNRLLYQVVSRLTTYF